jgi:hypothetical protein
MIEKITIDMLTQDSVSVKKQQYTTVDGVEYPIGQPHRKAYINSTSGRAEVMAELPEAQRNAIFAIWGDTPTVNEAITD